MRLVGICLICFIANINALTVSARTEGMGTMDAKHELVFGTYAESKEQLKHTLILIESLRTFAGKHSNAPISVFIPAEFENKFSQLEDKIRMSGAMIKTSEAPEQSLNYYFAGKVYAAGKAEAEAEGKADILVWMDEDTIILSEPDEFVLGDGISFAYRPVMHNRSGSLYSEPPDPFWSRVYEILKIDDTDLFSMVTPADRQTIRAYFNAGLLIVRPEKGILRKWGTDFTTLYGDTILADMCDRDIEKKIFIHQTALVGAAINILNRDEMLELSDHYNYPVFFHYQYEADREFGSIENAITLRYDVYFRNPDPDWSSKLKGPSNLVDWLKKRLGN